MSFVQIPQGSEEWEVAFFHSIQSRVMLRLDEGEPGYVTRIYEELGDSIVLDLFNETISRFGFEIAKDEKDKYWLLKTPESSLSCSSIYSLVEEYGKRQGIDQDSLYTPNEKTRKSHFSILANNHMQASNARCVQGKKDEWEFPDGSKLSINGGAIKTWGESPSLSEEDFEKFVANYRALLDKTMMLEESHEMEI